MAPYTNAWDARENNFRADFTILFSGYTSLDHVHDTTNTGYFRPQPVNVNSVILTLKDLNNTSAVGLDGVSLKYVKDALPVIAFYLTYLINKSIATCVTGNTQLLNLFKKMAM